VRKCTHKNENFFCFGNLKVPKLPRWLLQRYPNFHPTTKIKKC